MCLRSRTLAPLLGLLTAVGCAGTHETTVEPVEPVVIELPAIRNARVPMDGVLSGGQPTPEQIESAARGGFRTVINLRAEGEQGFEWERESVERLGMRYVQIPIAGADALTRDAVERIDAELEQARVEGPVLFHCGSGNRIGATLALRAAWLQQLDPEQSLQLGRSAGMTSLTPAVGELLGIDSVEP